MEDCRRQVGGIETVAQGAALALEEITTAVADVQREAQMVEGAAQTNLKTVEQIKKLLRGVYDAALAQAASSEEVSESAEQQTASTEVIAAQASVLARAAEQLQGLIQGLRT